MTFTPTFALTEEQELLAKTARRFLETRSGSDAVRAAMAGDTGIDESLWRELSGMGWPALAIADEHGGAGYGPVETGILMEELGRTLACVPFLSSVVLATTALAVAATPRQRAALLPAVATGERRLALACLGTSGRVDRDAVAVVAAADGDGWRLDGSSPWVLDGHTAHTILVAARREDGVDLLAVPADAGGLHREPLDMLDQTRRQARLRFDGVRVPGPARLGDGDAWPAIEAAVTAASVALACEQVGGTRRVLEMTVAHARGRLQFGRAIGSFQAVKHRLADILVELESARSTAAHATRALAAGDAAEIAIATPMAAAVCSEVFERATADAIQIFGGIGFTWEHDAHLWFKRAKSSKLLLGDPAHHRARLAATLGL